MIISNVIFSDVASQTGQSNKIDLKGVFTYFYVWAYPVTRRWVATCQIYRTPNTSSGRLFVDVKRKRAKKKIFSATVDIEVPGNGVTIPINISARFDSEGEYFLTLRFEGEKSARKTPIIIEHKKWPKLTAKHRRILAENENIQKTFMINVSCAQCSAPYKFAYSPLGPVSEEMGKGIKQFPPDALFECPECGHELNLKDFEGQLLDSVISNLKSGVF